MKIRFKLRFFLLLLIIGYGVFAVIYLWDREKHQSVVLQTPEGKRAEMIHSTSGNGKNDALARLKEEYKDKMTIIFFYDGYKNQKQAQAYIEVLKETFDILEPFKSSSDMVLYKTFTTDSQKCNVKNNLLVCNEKLIESFKNLGIDHFKLVILSPLEFNSTGEWARGKNSWITLSTFKKDMPNEEFNRFLGAQFAQNMGRSLGLSLESGNSSGSYSKRPNCALSPEEAESWWGSYALQFDMVRYYSGCGGYASSTYPEENTIMSEIPLKESYGIVSEDYLRGVLQCFYGNRNSINYPAGRVIVNLPEARSCEAFRNLYPDFWDE